MLLKARNTWRYSSTALNRGKKTESNLRNYNSNFNFFLLQLCHNYWSATRVMVRLLLLFDLKCLKRKFYSKTYFLLEHFQMDLVHSQVKPTQSVVNSDSSDHKLYRIPSSERISKKYKKDKFRKYSTVKLFKRWV